MFPFVILAALMGGGAFWVFTRKAAPVSQPAPAKPDATIMPVSPGVPLPSPVAPVMPVAPQPVAPVAPVGPSVADLSAQIAARDAELAAQQRQAEARGFVDRIAAVENLMKLDLVSLTTVERDDSRLNDFEQMERRTRGVPETVGELFARYTQDSDPAWQEAVRRCKDDVRRSCDSRGDFFGVCRTAEQPKCENKTPVPGYPAYAMQQRAQSDFTQLGAQAKEAALVRLSAWKRNEALPYEARLAERESQYRGMVAELKTRYGVTYTPMDAEAQAAHARAKV
jgi:hypothetical protein